MRARAAAAALLLVAAQARAAPADIIEKARYSEPTTRYDHAILGDAVEWGALVLTVDGCGGCAGEARRRKVTIRLPRSRVFEDIAPRLVEVDGDASPEVMVVETDLSRGARLALYDETGLIGATPYIGRPHRWLAPIGAADLDGDGQVEIAYVDRPHLARIVRIWRYVKGRRQLRHIADAPGFTNHQIGWDSIPGGIRDCGQGPEMIVADANWRAVYALAFRNRRFSARKIDAPATRRSLARARSCTAP